MEKHQEHNQRIATSTQEFQPILLKALAKFFTDFMKNFERPEGDKKPEQKIEIQRDGKTIASGVGRNGQLQDVKGRIPIAELSKLKEAIGSERGAQIGGDKAKDFKILVDGKPLLHTNRGIVLQNDLPQQMRDQFRAKSPPTAEQYAAKYKAAEEKLAATTAVGVTATTQTQKETEQATTPAAQTQKDQTTTPAIEKSGLQSAQTPTVNLRAELEKAGVNEQTITEVERQIAAKDRQSPIEPSQQRTDQSPIEPSQQRTDQSPSSIVQKTLPQESPLHRVMFALRQAAEKVGDLIQGSPTRSLRQDLRNLEVTQEAKMSLSQLSDRPPGQRSWSGKTYQITEGKDGALAIEAKGRGKILEFSKGRIEGSATETDLKNFKTLNQEIAKYNTKEQTQQPRLVGSMER